MAVSVRMNPILEKDLELAAQRQGVTKSQFIIDAVQRALGRKNPIELLDRLVAQEKATGRAVGKAFKGTEIPYDTEASRAHLIKTLEKKHGVRRAG